MSADVDISARFRPMLDKHSPRCIHPAFNLRILASHRHVDLPGLHLNIRAI